MLAAAAFGSLRPLVFGSVMRPVKGLGGAVFGFGPGFGFWLVFGAGAGLVLPLLNRPLMKS